MKLGRPSTYDPEVAETILSRMADGETLRAICRDPGMPPRRTVQGWAIDDVDGFSRRYTRARELQAHAMADELVEISDDGSNDWMDRNDPANPGFDLNGEHIQRSRVRVDTRKWLLAKVLPKEFGDRVQMAHGGDPDAPPIRTVGLVTEDPVEAARAYQRLMNGDADA